MHGTATMKKVPVIYFQNSLSLNSIEKSSIVRFLRCCTFKAKLIKKINKL